MIEDYFNKTSSGIEYCLLKDRCVHMGINKICRIYNIWITEDDDILTDEKIHDFINSAISEYIKTKNR